MYVRVRACVNVCWLLLSQQARFNAALAFVNDPDKKFKTPLSIQQRLQLYGLYKQATEGDTTGTQAGRMQFDKRSEWHAWNRQKGKTIYANLP